MDRTQQIKEAHPWLSYDEVVKVLLYHHQGSSWIQNLKSDKLERSMEAFSKLLKSKNKSPETLCRLRSRRLLQRCRQVWQSDRSKQRVF